jgi:hypothetical protein
MAPSEPTNVELDENHTQVRMHLANHRRSSQGSGYSLLLDEIQSHFRIPVAHKYQRTSEICLRKENRMTTSGVVEQGYRHKEFGRTSGWCRCFCGEVACSYARIRQAPLGFEVVLRCKRSLRGRLARCQLPLMAWISRQREPSSTPLRSVAKATGWLALDTVGGGDVLAR